MFSKDVILTISASQPEIDTDSSTKLEKFCRGSKNISSELITRMANEEEGEEGPSTFRLNYNESSTIETYKRR